ncbi:MAG: hypothetical protein ACRDHU_07340 [Actinomycetota bacterium]
MNVEEPVAERSEIRVTPIRPAPPPSPDPLELAERAFRTALGLASLAAGFVTAAVAEAIRGEIREPTEEPLDDESWPKPLVPVVAGAALGVAVDTARAGVRAATTVGRSLRPWVSFAKSPSFVRERLGRIRERMNDLDDRWRAEQAEDERIGSSFVGAVLPQVVDATLAQIDLTELVLARVDLDRIVDTVDLERTVERIDLNAVASRIDVAAIVARVDLDAVVERVDVSGIVERLDLDAIVAKIDVDRIVRQVDIGRIVEGLDLDAVAARLNVDAVVRRLDLGAIAQEVIDQLDLAKIANDVIEEIDLPQIIREASGSMANETVEGIRAQGASADRAVSRLVDRILGRDERTTEAEDRT